jgi:hypothetical protein
MQIIHSMYGEYFYHACKDQWQRLTEENYPQLAKVKILD